MSSLCHLGIASSDISKYLKIKNKTWRFKRFWWFQRSANIITIIRPPKTCPSMSERTNLNLPEWQIFAPPFYWKKFPLSFSTPSVMIAKMIIKRNCRRGDLFLVCQCYMKCSLSTKREKAAWILDHKILIMFAPFDPMSSGTTGETGNISIWKCSWAQSWRLTTENCITWAFERAVWKDYLSRQKLHKLIGE